ncbi:substrate-binding domain-containing protein [Nocardia sp. ET3-3]|uniref:Substrate-binding domain-containing protein n=1 Tax=Nocardia terrae TaxID=2675851 RepID=A0A7K1VBL4_9NOCA|nr:substrate-binding domain-containing protein [Nocardia terrae]MVU83488.1 substrate-binding domain-containing protein [Nocardia terrae]
MSWTHRRRWTSALVCVSALALAATACSSGKDSGSNNAGPQHASGTVSLVYAQKQGDQEYFIGEADGAKAKAKELGVDLKVVNLGNDANKAVTEVQNAVNQKANGVIVVVPDPSVGPQVAQLAKSGGVALLTSDDQVCANGPDPSSCSKDNLVPRVGFSGTQMGTEVGTRAGEDFKKLGWKAEDTAIVDAWKQDVTVCTDRVKANQKAFKDVSGADVKVIEVGTDNTPSDAQNKISATVAGNRSVKNWIVMGCNDENVSGGVAAIQNAGYAADNVLGVGLGAYLACKEWRGGKPTGFKAALFINGKDVGALAVQTMYDYLKNGKAMPPEAFAPTKMVDATNWQQAGVTCS